MNNVKETNVDNVIPFRKPKSGLHEPVINETLIRLNDYLKRINKYSVRELESGNYGLEDFNDFEIGEPKLKECHYKCRFSYNPDSKMCEFVYHPDFSTTSIPIEKMKHIIKGLSFRKNAIRDNFRRKKLSIWIASNVFSYVVGEDSTNSSTKELEDELDAIFRRGVFGDEHNFILYD
jgi:hypothetical protein